MGEDTTGYGRLGAAWARQNRDRPMTDDPATPAREARCDYVLANGKRCIGRLGHGGYGHSWNPTMDATPAREETLRALSDAATPGPWVRVTEGNASVEQLGHRLLHDLLVSLPDGIEPHTDATYLRTTDDRHNVAFIGNGPRQTENGDFIVAAVEYVREALAAAVPPRPDEPALCGAVLTCARPIHDDPAHERADGVPWVWPVYEPEIAEKPVPPRPDDALREVPAPNTRTQQQAEEAALWASAGKALPHLEPGTDYAPAVREETWAETEAGDRVPWGKPVDRDIDGERR